jgi:pimeloyl-ACP methyl ester carboxylesterase
MLHWDEEFCERLVAGSRFVIRYDHRDTGRSVTYPPGAPRYTGRDLAEDAIGVLDAIDVDRAHVVGISMGGGIAQYLGVHHPGRVASLTLIATSPLGAAQDDPDLPPSSEELSELGAAATPDWSDREAVVEYMVADERLYTSKSRPVAEEFLREFATRRSWFG